MKRVAALLLVVLAPLARAGDGATAPAPAPKPAMADVRRDFLDRCRYAPAEHRVEVGEPAAIRGVLAEAVRFPSPMRSSDPERNDVVRGKLFHTKEPERAAVIALGGWRFDPATPEVALRIAEGSGIQVLWLEIPFQGSRTPQGRMSGDLTLSADLEQTEKTFVQLAQDVSRAVEWLVRERGVARDRIGILGTSLGGFAAGTLYGMDDRFACAALLLAGADVASVLYSDSWLTKPIADALRERGLDEEAVRARLRAIDPLTWARKERAASLFVLAAEKDEIVPLASTRKLVDAYGAGAHLEIVKDAQHRSADRLFASVPLLVEHFRRCLVPASSSPPR